MKSYEAWGMALFMAGGAMLPMCFALVMDSVMRPVSGKRTAFRLVVSFFAFLFIFRAFIGWMT